MESRVKCVYLAIGVLVGLIMSLSAGYAIRTYQIRTVDDCYLYYIPKAKTNYAVQTILDVCSSKYGQKASSESASLKKKHGVVSAIAAKPTKSDKSITAGEIAGKND